MLIRTIRARVPADAAGPYEQWLRANAIPLLRAQPGLVALHVGRKPEADTAEFVIVSVWRDRADLQAFAVQAESDLLAAPEGKIRTVEFVVQEYQRL
jgi:heme-degrading monooxygenase HmoA